MGTTYIRSSSGWRGRGATNPVPRRRGGVHPACAVARHPPSEGFEGVGHFIDTSRSPDNSAGRGGVGGGPAAVKPRGERAAAGGAIRAWPWARGASGTRRVGRWRGAPSPQPPALVQFSSGLFSDNSAPGVGDGGEGRGLSRTVQRRTVQRSVLFRSVQFRTVQSSSGVPEVQFISMAIQLGVGAGGEGRGLFRRTFSSVQVSYSCSSGSAAAVQQFCGQARAHLCTSRPNRRSPVRSGVRRAGGVRTPEYTGALDARTRPPAPNA